MTYLHILHILKHLRNIRYLKIDLVKFLDMEPFHYDEPLYFSSIIDLIIITVMSVLIIAVNRKYLNDMDEDDRTRHPGTPPCLISDVMRTRTKFAIVLIPYYYAFAWFLSQGFYLPDWFYHLLCYDQYIKMFLLFFFSLTSLTIAVMRYTFIVHNRKVIALGKDKIKKMFHYGSVVIPLILAALHALFIPVPPSGYNLPHRICTEFLETTFNMTCGDLNGVKDDCAPILSVVQQHTNLTVRKVVGIFVKGFFVFTYTNIIDGILYWKTFKLIRE